MEVPRTQGIAPWVWILIVLAALILVFVIWWAVAAQSPERVASVPPEREEVARPPAVQPAEQPVVLERERPVNIYIEREQPRPSVILVPRDEQPPQARERLRQVDLPDRFRYQNKIWEPSGDTVISDEANLMDTGASVDGNIVYAEQYTAPPYDDLYLETGPGTGIYIQYEPAG